MQPAFRIVLLAASLVVAVTAPFVGGFPQVSRNDPAESALARLAFTQDYFPGTRDATGQYMGGTAAMWLIGRDGKLFAAIGCGQDQPGDDPRPGARILRKDTTDGPWQVDHQFPAGCRRVDGLVSFAFTTDGQGKALPKPVRLPLASPSELRGPQAASSERELDIKAFFNQAWDTPNARRRGAIVAHKRFLPVTDPKSGEPLWLCGAWVERPGSPNPPNNGSCYRSAIATAATIGAISTPPRAPSPPGRSSPAVATSSRHPSPASGTRSSTSAATTATPAPATTRLGSIAGDYH